MQPLLDYIQTDEDFGFRMHLENQTTNADQLVEERKARMEAILSSLIPTTKSQSKQKAKVLGKTKSSTSTRP
jgi:hypothetical protein